MGTHLEQPKSKENLRPCTNHPLLPKGGRLPAPCISMSNDYRSQVPHSLTFALCIAWVGCLARKKNPMGLA